MRWLLIASAVCASLPACFAQTADEHIDLYFGDWRAAPARTVYGTLQVHDVLTRGNPMNPERKGAVLRFIKSFLYAELPPGAKPASAKLADQQDILYIVGGRGSISAGSTEAPLHRGVAVLVPSGSEYTLRNEGAEPLSMYLVSEPTRPGFQAHSKMVVRDENVLPIASSSDHWDRIVKKIFSSDDGLSTLGQFSTVALDPLTITQPDLVRSGDFEEVWTELNGTSIAFLGSRLHRQGPGVAFLTPPDHKTPMSSLNYSENEAVKLLYFKSTSATGTAAGN